MESARLAWAKMGFIVYYVWFDSWVHVICVLSLSRLQGLAEMRDVWCLPCTIFAWDSITCACLGKIYPQRQYVDINMRLLSEPLHLTVRHKAVNLRVFAISKVSRVCSDVSNLNPRTPTAPLVGLEASSTVSARHVDVAIHQILAALKLFVDILDQPDTHRYARRCRSVVVRDTHTRSDWR
jgi:hypothetical protein